MKVPLLGQRAWVGLWLLLAWWHVGQGVLNTGGAGLPGDLGDGRLNMLQLEHGYQALIGRADFLTTSQFYPVEGSVAQSDMHLGTLPLYAAGRFVGASVETAFQLWVLAVVALNVWAAWRLLRKVDTPWWLLGPLGFLMAAPATVVYQAGMHIQVLPVFAFLLGLEQAVGYLQTRSANRLAYVAGCLGWLHLCSPYLGFYGTVALGLFVVVGLWGSSLAVGRRRGREDELGSTPNPRRSWIREWRGYLGKWRGDVGAGANYRGDNDAGHRWLLALSGVAAIFAILMYAVYAVEAGHGGTRAWVELRNLAPRPQDWLSAPGGHWLYGGGWNSWLGLEDPELRLFSGWLPWLGMAAGIYWRACDRSLWSRHVIGPAAVAALGVALFVTRWGDEGAGLYLCLGKWIEPLRAFRASGRSICVIHPLQVLAWAGMGSVLARSVGRDWVRNGCLGLAIWATVATLFWQQRTMSKEVVQMRRAAVLEQWEEAGGRDVLVLAPGHSNQPRSNIHLDAWAAAQEMGKVTVNGYSGKPPASHRVFLEVPTVEHGRELLDRLGIDAGKVSWVTSWGVEAERALGIERYGSRPVRRLEGFGLQPVAWNLSFALERYEMEGQTMYQFTPPAEVVFALPEGARKLRYEVAMRDGSYDRGGKSDGVGIRWMLIGADGERVLEDTYLNARDNVDQRGILSREVELPEGLEGERRVKLEVGYGPAGDGAWDWPLFGGVRVER